MFWRISFVAAGLIVFWGATGSVTGNGQESPEPARASAEKNNSATEVDSGPLHWYSDYSEAIARAVEEKKMMFILFFDPKPKKAQSSFERKTLADRSIQDRLREYVLLRVPVSATIEDGENKTRLLDHTSFKYMYGSSGLAIIDVRDRDKPYFGRVVSCFPFDSPSYYAAAYESVRSVKVILDLPPGTVTQRTMIYAVRMHPERPSSTSGRAHPVLLNAAYRHSRNQARLRLLGHFGWEGRFQQIWSRLRGGTPPSEVCAESWAGSRLVTACIDCVNSWRQSPGHWRAVSARQPAFGYDIRRGGNGVWYATGIFGG